MNGVLVPDAIEANKAGRLTDDQRRGLRGMSGGLRRGEVQLSGALLVIGLLVWFAPGPASAAVTKPLVGIAFLVVAAAILIRGLAGADPLTNDLRTGNVASVEGAVSKRAITSDSRGSSSTSYFLDVEHKAIHVWRSAYDAAPNAGWMRLYYLPRSHRLVNFERLPDHEVPAGSISSPADMLKGIGSAFFAHDEVARAEARAQMASVGNAMKPVEADPTPPASVDRDPAALHKGLVGEWVSGMLDVTFAPDGTLQIKMPLGPGRSGSWSVDDSGRLVSDVTGASEAADAWISAGVLTISTQGHALSFQRKA